MLVKEVTYPQVPGTSPTTPLELMSTATGRLAEQVTPVHIGEQGSDPVIQLLRPEGQVLAVRRMLYMAVLDTGGGGGGDGGRGGGDGGKGQDDPMPLPEARTTEEFQGDGIAPQRAVFPGLRVKAFMRPMAEAHDCGMVEAKLFPPRSIWVNPVSADHAEGKVPVSRFDLRLSDARIDKVDHEEGKVPETELPSKLREVKEEIHWKF